MNEMTAERAICLVERLLKYRGECNGCAVCGDWDKNCHECRMEAGDYIVELLKKEVRNENE